MSACIDWGAVALNLFWLIFGGLALLGVAFLSLLLRD